ncbi:hypothetical protein PLICRDRAFT_49365 [Plicaturopsis crispa FD-325 SS-3]|nr:hypothetical protein PLICRDRAFT_49365 [Plicaturopsis crispa FD-325 SS-3]
MALTSKDNASLMPVLLIFAFLIFASLGWCIVSSCMGRPILRFFSGMWDSAVRSARSEQNASFPRRRRELGLDAELWEMEHRGRVG